MLQPLIPLGWPGVPVSPEDQSITNGPIVGILELREGIAINTINKSDQDLHLIIPHLPFFEKQRCVSSSPSNGSSQ